MQQVLKQMLSKSAFLKGNTREHILTFYDSSSDANIINRDEVIKIKFEIDTNPPVGATYETKFGLLPSPYQVRLYERFANMDFTQARQDVLPFVKDKTKLDLWSQEFFTEITKRLAASPD